MSKYVPYNLNCNIKLLLTEVGMNLVKKYYRNPHHEFKFDDKGFVTFQMHEAMRLFGSHVNWGEPLPIEMIAQVELQESVTTCPCCRGEAYLFGNPNNMYSVYCDYSPSENQWHILWDDGYAGTIQTFNYCPNCGRKLGDQNARS